MEATEFVEELIEELEQFYYEQGISTYKIIENFKLHGYREFEVECFKVENEDSFVICSDYYDILLSNHCVCNMFLIDQIKAIHKTYENNIVQVKLEFKDGFILLQGTK